MSSIKRKANRFDKWSKGSFSLDKLFSFLFRRSFHYHIKMSYTPDSKRGNINSTSVRIFSTKCRSVINNRHFLKKLLVGSLITDSMPIIGGGGKVEIADISYLGWFTDEKVG